MANPFPGMDPYLEGPRWVSFHSNLANEITADLLPRLLPRYLAITAQRIVVAPVDDEASSRNRWPDVGITTERLTPDSIAVATAPAPMVVNVVVPETEPHYGVDIVEAGSERLVTAIEILSPSNMHGEGAGEYAVKRRELLAGPANLVEIDLLRAGRRVPVDRKLLSVPYFVFVCRANARPRAETWPIALAGPLPTVPIPLDPGVPDAMLDLQQVVSATHAKFAFSTMLDYRKSPPGTFSPDDLAWIDERLRVAGQRS